MKKHTSPIRCSTFYHVYNRGINGENIFKEERNYAYFLQKYAKFIQPVAETYAYCLLKNHFHLLIRTRDAPEILENLGISNPDKDVNKLISTQFANLFNSYAQAINKAYKRTGGLFEELFRRIPVDNSRYFIELVYYIHANPQKHGFVSDFREYPHSSYLSHLSTGHTKLNRAKLHELFGGTEEFYQYHRTPRIIEHLEAFDIDLGD